MDKEIYFFYEWLILGKNMSEYGFKLLSKEKVIKLKKEYSEFKKKLAEKN